MKCPKCKEGRIGFEGFAGKCDKCRHVEYLDPYMPDRIRPIDLRDWFDRQDSYNRSRLR